MVFIGSMNISFHNTLTRLHTYCVFRVKSAPAGIYVWTVYVCARSTYSYFYRYAQWISKSMCVCLCVDCGQVKQCVLHLSACNSETKRNEKKYSIATAILAQFLLCKRLFCVFKQLLFYWTDRRHHRRRRRRRHRCTRAQYVVYGLLHSILYCCSVRVCKCHVFCHVLVNSQPIYVCA